MQHRLREASGGGIRQRRLDQRARHATAPLGGPHEQPLQLDPAPAQGAGAETAGRRAAGKGEQEPRRARAVREPGEIRIDLLPAERRVEGARVFREQRPEGPRRRRVRLQNVQAGLFAAAAGAVADGARLR